MLDEGSRRVADLRIREPGLLGDLDQRVLAVREVQHPEQRELVHVRAVAGADRPIEAAPAELRLALGTEVHVGVVRLEHVEDVQVRLEAARERLGPDEVEVVRGGVVLGEAAGRRARERADREVEAR